MCKFSGVQPARAMKVNAWIWAPATDRETFGQKFRPGRKSFAQVKTRTLHSGETICKPSLGTLGVGLAHGFFSSLLFSSLLFSSLLFSSLLFSSRLVSSRLVSSRLVSSRLVSSRLVSSRLVSSGLFSPSCGILQVRCVRNCAV